MIDTIMFKIDTVENPDARIWRYNIPDHNILQTGADTFKGNIRNMQIFENMNGLTVRGSIAKFFYGNNVQNFTRENYTDALKEFEQITGLNLHLAKLKRVDFGESIIVEKDAGEYIRLFSNISRYKKDVIIGNKGIQTVTYFTNTGSYAFCIYDKMQELEDRKEDAPELFKNCNILRMEYRILKSNGIREKLGNGINISPWVLAEKEKYKILNQLYLDFYKSIPKAGRRVFYDKNRQYTPTEYFEIQTEYARQIDPNFTNDLLNFLSKNGNLSRQNLKRIKAQEKKNSQNYAFSDTNGLIVELNEKMHCRTF
ncbi:MAG: hypothetical protein J5687_09155 [Treponema sp.]|nr:hypothetical protein [Treponema sp.]